MRASSCVQRAHSLSDEDRQGRAGVGEAVATRDGAVLRHVPSAKPSPLVGACVSLAWVPPSVTVWLVDTVRSERVAVEEREQGNDVVESEVDRREGCFRCDGAFSSIRCRPVVNTLGIDVGHNPPLRSRSTLSWASHVPATAGAMGGNARRAEYGAEYRSVDKAMSGDKKGNEPRLIAAPSQRRCAGCDRNEMV